MRNALFTLAILAAPVLFAQDRADQEFHSNGRLKSTRYSIGAREWFITYHTNGRVEEKGAFFMGKPDGEWTRSDADGRLLVQARFEHGHRVGIWRFAGADGTSGQLQFRDGRLEHGSMFDAQGGLVASRSY